MEYRRSSTSYLVVIAILIVLVGLDFLGVFGFLKAIIIKGTDGSARSTSFIRSGFNNAIDIIRNVGSLNEENKDLKSKNKKLVTEIAQLRETKKENEDLKKSLSIGGIVEQNKILVHILSNPLQGNQGIFFLDKGSKDGIRTGQVIIDSDSHLIGKVSKTSSYYSEGIFSTYLYSYIPVMVAGKDIKGVARANTQGLELEMVPKEKDLKVEDILLLGADTDYLDTKNNTMRIIIGQVKKITSREQDIFYTANIDTLVSYSKIKIAFVLIK